jgi:spermidine/putrescine transport system ATP-binding protein
MDNSAIIYIKNLTKAFDGKKAIDNINLYIKKGEFVTLLGPSGCGKTTLIRTLAGFEKPDEGRIYVYSEDITSLPPHLRHFNTVFQKYALFPHLNVYGNIAFGLKMKKVKKTIQDKKGNQKEILCRMTNEEIEIKVRTALKMVGLTDYEYRDVDSLSGGQQQRVAIARAIVNEPEVLLLDEPLAALDLKMRKEMQLELKEMHDKLGITFVYVTHDQEEALTMSDTIVVMKDGVIQQIGKPAQIYNTPVNAFVANFIGESNIIDGVVCGKNKIRILEEEFNYTLDPGFEIGEPVDVMLRPEDIRILGATKEGCFEGQVTSCVFKGIYYQMYINVDGGYELKVQDTNCFEVGEKVIIAFKEKDLHVMKKIRNANVISGEMVDNNTVMLYGAKFACNGLSLVNGGRIGENGQLTDSEDNAVNLAGTKVIAEIPFDGVKLFDYVDEGVMEGEIISTMFKGNHNHLEVRTKEGYFYVNTKETWDNGDKVGINIKPETIKLTKAEA